MAQLVRGLTILIIFQESSSDRSDEKAKKAPSSTTQGQQATNAGFKSHKHDSVESWSSTLMREGSLESMATVSGLDVLFGEGEADSLGFPPPKITVQSTSTLQSGGDESKETYAEVVQNIKRQKNVGDSPTPVDDAGVLDWLFNEVEPITNETEVDLKSTDPPLKSTDSIDRENSGSTSSELLNLFKEDGLTVHPIATGNNPPVSSPHIPSNLENRPKVEPRVETMLDIDEGLGTDVSSRVSDVYVPNADAINEKFVEMKVSFKGITYTHLCYMQIRYFFAGKSG